MTIIVDTREQRPYWNTNRQTLLVGDYTSRKLLNKFHIERKSLGDLYGTLTVGNRRFKYELFRAAYAQIRLEVYIEGSYEAFINKQFPKGAERKFDTEGLKRLISTFKRKYFLEFHWHKNRKKCQIEVERRLFYEEKINQNISTFCNK